MRHLLTCSLFLVLSVFACRDRAHPAPLGSTCPATPHSQGGPATLALVGGSLVADALPVMPRQMALLVSSPFPSAQPEPFGEGFLCLHALHIARVVPTTTAGPLDLGAPPEVGYYQLAFRDCLRYDEGPVGCRALGFNTTNVVYVQ